LPINGEIAKPKSENQSLFSPQQSFKQIFRYHEATQAHKSAILLAKVLNTVAKSRKLA